jgi:murein DD-endopeptidase MepM/ murein hydrolase activator NlpD
VPAPKAEPEAPKTAAPAADDKPEFRWPARGRIIQGFKSGANDGIAIAVPEGTAVKAAEAGVVAYAGSELKGYGNLVLIRHPNGFVSAYAHNGELNVKRGDTVRRGQVIAKSGQSGNVSSPQLHFELRKGSTPVDPTAYLAGL